MRLRLKASVVTLISLTAALTACGSSSGSSSAGGAVGAGGNTDPLKVALIPPSGGALALFGQDEVKAWQLAADEANAAGGVSGHQVQIVSEQTDGTPAATVAATRKAVQQDGSPYISGVITSAEWTAMQKQLPSLNAVGINSTGKDDNLTGADCNANSFRVVQSTAMDINALAAQVQGFPAKKWAIMSVDYGTGHTAAALFTRAVQSAGGTIVAEKYAKLGTTDFGSVITELSQSGADGLFAVEFGGDAVAFINQGAQFKLFDHFRNVVGLNMVSEPLFTLGSKIVGFYNNLGYASNLTVSGGGNSDFVAKWKAKYNTTPYYVQADAYTAAQFLFEAVKKANSVKPADVKAAMNGLAFTSVVGPVTLRAADHQLLRPSFVGQIVDNGAGSLGWKIIGSQEASTTTPQADPACKI